MHLKEKVLSAIAWSTTAKFAGQMISWVVTIIVIRLLEPADYGLMAMAILIPSFFSSFNPMGAALIQRKELDEQTKRQIFGLMIVINLACLGILLVLAPIIANFFDEPRLELIIVALSLQFIFLPFAQFTSSLLERELQLRTTSIVYLIAALIGSASTLLLAYLGYGVWALVFGLLAVDIARAIGLNIASRCLCMPSFNFSGTRKILSFGSFVTGERILWYVYNQADVMIVGKILGKELLGIYSVAMHLSTLIMHKTGEILYVVALPAFSKIQQEKELLGRSFFTAMRIMGFILFPLFFGMSSISPELVKVLLGNNWLEVIPILTILCLLMPLRMLNNLYTPLLQGIGKADISASNLLIAAILMPIAFLIGSTWGLIGVSLSWLIMYPIVFIIASKRVMDALELKLYKLLHAIAKPALLSALMYGSVAYSRSLLPPDTNEAGQLLLLILIGSVTYIVLVLTLHRQILVEIKELLSKRKTTHN